MKSRILEKPDGKWYLQALLITVVSVDVKSNEIEIQCDADPDDESEIVVHGLQERKLSVTCQMISGLAPGHQVGVYLNPVDKLGENVFRVVPNTQVVALSLDF